MRIDYNKNGIVHELVGNRGGKQIGLNGFQYSHDRRKTLAAMGLSSNTGNVWGKLY